MDFLKIPYSSAAGHNKINLQQTKKCSLCWLASEVWDGAIRLWREKGINGISHSLNIKAIMLT